MIKAVDPEANTPKRQAPNWLLRIMGLFVNDIKTMLPNLGRNLSCSGAKAEKTLGFTFIPIKDAMAASAKSIRQFAS